MANERKTIVTYKGDGTQRTFAFPFDYLRKSFIKVTLDDDNKEYGVDYTVTNKQVEFTTAPANGVVIVIYRETTTDRLVAWEDASVLRASDMTLFEVQLLHLAEETQDKVQESGLAKDDYDGIWDARLTRIKNVLDPVDALDALNKRYFESVQAGFIQASQSLVNEATNQKNQATTQAQNAASSASAALASQNAAKTSEINAKTSETNALSYKNSASASATSASTSATNAKTSETNAKISEMNAKTSETNAKISENNAYTYAQQASNSAGYTKAESDAKYNWVMRGWIDDFNNALTQGEYSVGTGSTIPNAPFTGAIFGKLRVFVNDGTTHNNTSNWIWQWFDCTNGNVYRRYKTNNTGWKAWQRLLTYEEAYLPAYDSGWQYISVNTTITLTHNLGFMPLRVHLWASNRADGIPLSDSDYLIPIAPAIYSGGLGVTNLVFLDNTVAKIRGGTEKLWAFIAANGTFINPTTGYVRLVMYR